MEIEFIAHALAAQGGERGLKPSIVMVAARRFGGSRDAYGHRITSE
jgi:hypothetical protein